MSHRSTSEHTKLARLLRPIFVNRMLVGLSSYEDIRTGRRNYLKLGFGFLQHVEYTGSHPITEVKRHRAWMVLGRVTAPPDLFFCPLFKQIFNAFNEILDVQSHKKSLKHSVRNIMIFYYVVVFTDTRSVRCTPGGELWWTSVRFIILIYELRQSFSRSQSNSHRLPSYPYPLEDIYRLDKKYNTLYNISLMLNEKYSILIAITFFMDTAGIASGVFKVSQNFIETYIAQAAPKISPILIHELEWWCHHLCFFLWVINTSVSTQQKAYKTALLAHKLHLHNTNPDLTAATGTFRRHLKLQEMKFTGSDMFDVNYETMLSILSTMGTYGIILIQFQIQIASNQEEKGRR
ncbi:hypothetical protein WDU94_006237 [Cyamophila willieti]